FHPPFPRARLRDVSTEHISCFGNYVINPDLLAEPLEQAPGVFIIAGLEMIRRWVCVSSNPYCSPTPKLKRGYRMAKHLGVSHTTVYRVWLHFGIQSHRLRRYMATIRNLKRRQPILSDCTSSHPSAPRCSVWMKRAPFKPLIGLTQCCHFPLGEPNVMGLTFHNGPFATQTPK